MHFDYYIIFSRWKIWASAVFSLLIVRQIPCCLIYCCLCCTTLHFSLSCPIHFGCIAYYSTKHSICLIWCTLVYYSGLCIDKSALFLHQNQCCCLCSCCFVNIIVQQLNIILYFKGIYMQAWTDLEWHHQNVLFLMKTYYEVDVR